MNASSFLSVLSSRWLSLIFAVVLFVVVTAIVIAQAAPNDNGVVYAMDDVYIHMALAKNLVLHGVWGVTPWETTNASSSPLWVALLAVGFFVVGVKAWLPLLMAAASSLLVVALSWRACTSAAAANDRQIGTVLLTLVAPLAVVAFASLPALTTQGMEHPLHAALMLTAALSLSRIAATGAKPWLPGYVVLFAALPILRYESLWLVALGSALLALRRRYALAALTLASGIVPLVAFGLWAMTQGQNFLPAAILTKSVGPALLAGDDLRHLVARFTWHPVQRIWSVPVLCVLWAVACSVLALRLLQLRWKILDRRWLVLLGVFVIGVWTHATFATFGWGARYEAYLIVLGIVSLACWFSQAEERQAIVSAFATPALRTGGAIVATCLVAAFLYTGVARLIVVTRNAVIATHEVRDRDIFIARFLAEAYPQQSVLAMNVGAIAWSGTPHLTDALALASPEVLRLYLQGALTPQSLDAVARQRAVKVAVIFDGWFADWTGGKPPWIAVAEVEPHANRPLNYTLYVLNDADGRVLAERLKAYQPDAGFKTTWRLLPPYQ